MAHLHLSPSLSLLKGQDWLSVNFSTLCFVSPPASGLFQTLLSRKVEVHVEGGIYLTPAVSAGPFLLLGPGRCLQLTMLKLAMFFRASTMGLSAVIPLKKPMIFYSGWWLKTSPVAPRNFVLPLTFCCKNLASPLGGPNGAKKSWLVSPLWGSHRSFESTCTSLAIWEAGWSCLRSALFTQLGPQIQHSLPSGCQGHK